MDTTTAEALTTARRLIRTLDSAPDALKQAQSAVAALQRATGWTAQQAQEILEMSEWLATRPAPAALKLRCQQVLKRLG